MTSLNNPVNLPLDTNGYVKSSIWGQNMNPNVNNVAGSVAGSVGSVTNPVTTWTTISHQTGLSAVVSTALAPVNIGSAISTTKDGKIQIACSGHISAGIGGIRIARTRNAIVDYINQDPYNESSTSMNSSLFTDGADVSLSTGAGFNTTTRLRLLKAMSYTITYETQDVDVILLDVLNGDSLQFQVTNSTASDTVYIDDLVVQQQ